MGYMTIYHISRLFFKYDKFDSDQSNVSKVVLLRSWTNT